MGDRAVVDLGFELAGLGISARHVFFKYYRFRKERCKARCLKHSIIRRHFFVGLCLKDDVCSGKSLYMKPPVTS